MYSLTDRPLQTCDILVKGTFPESQIEVDWNRLDQSFPTELNARMDTFWLEHVTRTDKNRYLFNGDLCTLDAWEARPDRLRLSLGLTNYKTLLYFNHHSDAMGQHLSRALGISAVLVSQDGQVILIERSQDVGEFPGKWDVLGGHIDPGEHAVAGRPEPFRAIKAEIFEEAKLRSPELDSLVCIGLLEVRSNRKPELIFRAKSHKSAREIIRLALADRSPEFHRMFAISDEFHSLKTYLFENNSKFSPSALGSLWLHLQMKGENQ